MRSDPFGDIIEKVLPMADRIKKALIAKGKRKGWTKCPECGEKIHAVLAGSRNHLHMACETKGCCMRVME